MIGQMRWLGELLHDFEVYVGSKWLSDRENRLPGRFVHHEQVMRQPHGNC